jgi:hypothetical protein
LRSRYIRQDGQHFTSRAALSRASNSKPIGMQEPQPNSGPTNLVFQSRGRRRSMSVASCSNSSSTDGAVRSDFTIRECLDTGI